MAVQGKTMTRADCLFHGGVPGSGGAGEQNRPGGGFSNF